MIFSTTSPDEIVEHVTMPRVELPRGFVLRYAYTQLDNDPANYCFYLVGSKTVRVTKGHVVSQAGFSLNGTCRVVGAPRDWYTSVIVNRLRDGSFRFCNPDEIDHFNRYSENAPAIIGRKSDEDYIFSPDGIDCLEDWWGFITQPQ